MKNILLFCVLLVIAFTNCHKTTEQLIPLNNLTYLKVREDKIVDENGNEILLHGFNIGDGSGVSGDWYYPTVYQRGENPNVLFGYGQDLLTYSRNEDDINIMKNMGVNIVRLWFTIDKLNDTLLFEKQLESFDKTIDFYGKNNIYVMPVLYDVGENDNPACRSRREFNLNLWEEGRGSAIWNKVIETWGIIAQRYKDNPYIAGYDFINEPKTPNQEILCDFYADIIGEIRTYDQKHIVFPETDVLQYRVYDKQWTNLDDNLAVNYHFYQPWWFTKYGGQYPGEHDGITYNRQWIEDYFSNILNHNDIKGKPLMVSEFGFLSESLHGDNGARFIEDEVNTFNEKNISYMYYGYKNAQVDKYLLFINNQDVLQEMLNLSGMLFRGEIEYTDITTEQKNLYQTKIFYKNSYWESILKDGFTGRKH